MPQLKLWNRPGGVVEWLMAPVLKTGRVQALAGSNPAPSVSAAAQISTSGAEQGGQG